MAAHVFMRPERGVRRSAWAAVKALVFMVDGSYTDEGQLWSVGLEDERGAVLYEERGYSIDAAPIAKARLEQDISKSSVEDFLRRHVPTAE